MMNRAAFGLFEDAELEVSRKANKLLFICELSPVPVSRHKREHRS